jgi:hypothetical protein
MPSRSYALPNVLPISRKCTIKTCQNANDLAREAVDGLDVFGALVADARVASRMCRPPRTGSRPARRAFKNRDRLFNEMRGADHSAQPPNEWRSAAARALHRTISKNERSRARSGRVQRLVVWLVENVRLKEIPGLTC